MQRKLYNALTPKHFIILHSIVGVCYNLYSLLDLVMQESQAVHNQANLLPLLREGKRREKVSKIFYIREPHYEF